MADEFRRCLDECCCIGGAKCPCCNDFKNGDQEKLRRQARSILKRRNRKEIEEGLESYKEDE